MLGIDGFFLGETAIVMIPHGIVFSLIYYILQKMIKSNNVYYIVFPLSFVINYFLIKEFILILMLLIGGGHGSGIDHAPQLVYLKMPLLTHLIIAVFLFIYYRTKVFRNIIIIITVLYAGVVYKMYEDQYRLEHTPHPKFELSKTKMVNLDNKDMTNLSEKIKQITQRASVPLWEKPKYSDLNISKTDFYMLRTYILEQPNITYQIKSFMKERDAIVSMTTRPKREIRFIFRFSKKKKWQLDEIVQRNTSDEREANLFGDTKDTTPRDRIKNPEIIDYYKKAFQESLKSFLYAQTPYTFFKERVKYSFALRCLERNDNIYRYVDYRRQIMEQLLAQDQNKSSIIRQKLKALRNLNLTILDKIQKEILEDTTLKPCKVQMSLDKMYESFIDRYLKKLSHGDWDIPDAYYGTAIKKEEPKYENFVRRQYFRQRLYQIKSKRKWKDYIKERILSLLKQKANPNQKVLFNGANISAKRYPLEMATEICDETSIKQLLEAGAKVYQNENILFNTVLMCSPKIIQLFMDHGIDITRDMSLDKYRRDGNHVSYPMYQYMLSRMCLDPYKEEMIDFLSTLMKQDIVPEEEYLRARVTSKDNDKCNKKNLSPPYGLPRNFVYTGKNISKEALIKLMKDKTLLAYIKQSTDLHIEDIALDPKKRKILDDEQHNMRIPINWDAIREEEKRYKPRFITF